MDMLTQNTLVKVLEGGRDTVDSAWRQFVAFFPYYRMYYIVRGSGVLVLKEGSLNLREGHMYFVPAFSVVTARCQYEMEHCWIHFTLQTSAANYLTLAPPLTEILAEPADLEAFNRICELVARRGTAESTSCALGCDGLAQYLLSRFVPKDEYLASAEGVRFEPVLRYIEEHISEPISNADLAAIMFISENYFSNIFSKQLGVSPKQYILQRRMNAAATMLFETTKSIKEITRAVGYDDDTYFNRLFCKYTGMPPGRYRKLAIAPQSKK